MKEAESKFVYIIFCLDEDDATQNEDSHSQSRTVRKKALAKRQEKRRQQPDNPIALAQLRKFCEATVETGVGALVQQFQYIKNTTSVCRHKSAFEANPSKNRYKDVPCADKTRVILNWPDGGDDYIHANWVDFMGKYFDVLFYIHNVLKFKAKGSLSALKALSRPQSTIFGDLSGKKRLEPLLCFVRSWSKVKKSAKPIGRVRAVRR